MGELQKTDGVGWEFGDLLVMGQRDNTNTVVGILLERIIEAR